MTEEFECTLLCDGTTCEQIRIQNERNGKDSIRGQFCNNENKNICCRLCAEKNCRIRCLLKPVRLPMFEIDGSNIHIGVTTKGQSAEYRGKSNRNIILEEAIYLFYPKDFVSLDREKIIFIFKGTKMEGNLVDLTSEILGHETLHMLLCHFIGLDASDKLNNLDNFIRDDFREILRNSKKV